MKRTAHSPLIPEVGLLALPYHRWGTRWMTPHHVLPRLASYFNVVWLEPAHHWSGAFQLQRRRVTDAVASLPGSFDRYVPEAWLPEVYRPAWLRRMLFRARLQRAWGRLDGLNCTARVLYLWHPQFENALDVGKHHLSLYHIDDEYAFASDAPPVGAQEARVLRKVDQVFVISPRLMERKSGINPRMAFAPEGVDFRLYAMPAREPLDLAPIRRPRIGYTGHLKSQLDWPLLRALARRHPEWSFVFVGPRKPLPDPQEAIVEETASLANVHLLGPKTVTDLAAYPQHFDVCVMPYAVNEYTNNIYPLKLHEYLASGRPVVGSPIRSLEDFREVIALPANEEEWSAALAAALDPPLVSQAAVAARQDIARRFDWSEIVYGIAKTICERLGGEYSERLEKLDVSIAAPSRESNGSSGGNVA